jgi:hypothetical protein
MRDPRDLREQARQWRRQAMAHTPGVARALQLAAEQLEDQADRVETSNAPRGQSAHGATPEPAR